MIWGKKLENSRQNDKKWEVLAILSILILPYTDGFLGPPNLAILALFPNFALIRYLKSAFLQRFGNIWGVGTFWQIVLKSQKLTLKNHQYRVKWKKMAKISHFSCR